MIKRLLSCVREYRRDSLLAPLYVTMEVVIEVIIPLLIAKLIDFGLEKSDMGYILKMGLLLAGCCAVSLAFGVLSGRSAAIASAGFAKNLRHDMYHNTQDFSFSNIDRFSTASLITRLTTDVFHVQNAYMMVIRTAVRSPAMLVFSLAMAFRINSSLALVFLCIVPVLGGGIYLIMRNVHPIFRRVFRIYDRLNAVVQENLHGIRVVKSFVREEHEISKFNEISDRIYQSFTKAERIIALGMPLMHFCMYFCMVAISFLGAKLIIQSHGSVMSTGELMSMISYVMQILMSLMMLSMVLLMIIISRASAERITEVLSEKTTLHNPEHPIFSVKDGSIDFRNVTFTYARTAEKPVLSDVSLSIRSGETIGILGGTGSSKSSLVQLLPRLYDVCEGAVLVGGVDVREYDLETLRNAVSMVLQKNVLFSGTIRDNLRWGCETATNEELIRACQLAQADAFIRELPNGYDTELEQGGTNISGGQRQRLCIARALLKQPKILILDDSTSAVDTETDARIRLALQQELPNTTRLIIAQRIASVQNADRILVLDGGKINGFGTHEELLQNNQIYREVYESQVRKEDC